MTNQPKSEPRKIEKLHPTILETSVPGIFAAGDVRSGSVKRVASAVGEGAIIISQVHQFLSEQEERLLPTR